jgi:hypothetical protein
MIGCRTSSIHSHADEHFGLPEVGQVADEAVVSAWADFEQ